MFAVFQSRFTAGINTFKQADSLQLCIIFTTLSTTYPRTCVTQTPPTLTMEALHSHQMLPAAAIESPQVFRGASAAQWTQGPGGAPPGLPAGGADLTPTPNPTQVVAARLASASLTALALASMVGVVRVVGGAGLVLVLLELLVRAAAQGTAIGQLPVDAGDVDGVVVLQQLRGG